MLVVFTRHFARVARVDFLYSTIPANDDRGGKGHHPVQCGKFLGRKLHVGQATEQSKLEFGRPFLLDEVARTFPKLRLVISQLGQPWIDETIFLLGKHANVFADVSGLMGRPWQAYNALVAAYQYGVIEKLLFGSDFPYTNATDCIEAMYSLNQVAQGTNLPVVPREALRGIVERESLALLGLS